MIMCFLLKMACFPHYSAHVFTKQDNNNNNDNNSENEIISAAQVFLYLAGLFEVNMV